PLHAHFGRDHGNERGALLEGVNIVHGGADGFFEQVRLAGGNVGFFDSDFFQATDGNEGFAHTVFHAFNEGGHGHEAGNAEDDAEHREQGTEFVRPDFLEPDADGVEEVHA